MLDVKILVMALPRLEYSLGKDMDTQKSFGEIPVVPAVRDAQVVDAVPYEEKDEKITIVVIPTRAIHVRK